MTKGWSVTGERAGLALERSEQAVAAPPRSEVRNRLRRPPRSRKRVPQRAARRPRGIVPETQPALDLLLLPNFTLQSFTNSSAGRKPLMISSFVLPAATNFFRPGNRSTSCSTLLELGLGGRSERVRTRKHAPKRWGGCSPRIQVVAADRHSELLRCSQVTRRADGATGPRSAVPASVRHGLAA